MDYETTFAMIKPGAIHRGLSGEIIRRFEKRGLSILGLKMIMVTEKQAREHYIEHIEKPFYESLVDYITSGPVIVMCVYGKNAVGLVRNMAGDTDPLKSIPGTIRGDFSADLENNIIHTSDAKKTAIREMNIYFDNTEVLDYHRITDDWSFEVVKKGKYE
ncbi:MAG: nucleoside-diphosphate kinase [Mycoplasmatales bacterium]